MLTINIIAMSDFITLNHGSGGKASQDLIKNVFIHSFGDSNIVLSDSAILDVPENKLAFTSDSYVIDPIFFPGGDIGKLAIPIVIRSKPGKLSEEEYETMKLHTIKGAQLLFQHAQSEIENIAAEIALTHHERWDGSGYPGHVIPETGQPIPEYADEQGNPRGKKGEEIPIFGRVVALVAP